MNGVYPQSIRGLNYIHKFNNVFSPREYIYGAMEPSKYTCSYVIMSHCFIFIVLCLFSV